MFVDVLSFELRGPKDPIWLPYAQFVRSFLLPLAASRRLGVALDQTFVTRRDDLEPEEVYGWLTPLGRLRSPFLSLVSMPVWLSGSKGQGLYRARPMDDPEKARFVLESPLRRSGRCGG